jgi:hypothetical protein
MIHKVVSIFDQASLTFGRPVYVPALGSAIRSFQDEIQNNEQPSDLSRHPADFSLHHVADYDDNTGRFTNYEDVRIARGVDFQKA